MHFCFSVLLSQTQLGPSVASVMYRNLSQRSSRLQPLNVRLYAGKLPADTQWLCCSSHSLKKVRLVSTGGSTGRKSCTVILSGSARKTNVRTVICGLKFNQHTTSVEKSFSSALRSQHQLTIRESVHRASVRAALVLSALHIYLLDVM